MVWRLLRTEFADPATNLALEEALFKSIAAGRAPPTVRVWKNPSAVVVGRFQNMDDEVDWERCRALGVSVCRRFTGGGAVYHDEGTLNFTIACNAGHLPLQSDLLEKFRYFMWPIVSCAEKLGCRPQFLPPNSIADQKGAKFSGAAASIGKGSMLFHASVLVSSDLNVLRTILSGSANFKSMKVQSTRAPVCNLNQIGEGISVGKVESELISSAQRDLQIKFQQATVSDEEAGMVSELRSGKYSTVEWFRPAFAQLSKVR